MLSLINVFLIVVSLLKSTSKESGVRIELHILIGCSIDLWLCLMMIYFLSNLRNFTEKYRRFVFTFLLIASNTRSVLISVESRWKTVHFTHSATDFFANFGTSAGDYNSTLTTSAFVNSSVDYLIDIDEMMKAVLLSTILMFATPLSLPFRETSSIVVTNFLVNVRSERAKRESCSNTRRGNLSVYSI